MTQNILRCEVEDLRTIHGKVNLIAGTGGPPLWEAENKAI